MKIKSLHPFAILMIMGLLLMTSCGKEHISGSVSGVVTVYYPAFPLVKTPLEGIKLFLVNKDFKIDSVDYANNQAAIVDSASTASDGKYLIAGIPEGHYAIVPVPDSIMYRFEPEQDLDSVKFAIIEGSLDHQVDFTAAVPDGAADGFHVHLTIINRPNGGSVSIYRPVFLFNIIPSIRQIEIDNLHSFTTDDLTMNVHFGIFGYLYVVSNNFVIKTLDRYDKPLGGYWVTYDYFNTPAYSHWQIDWTAKSITRIE